MQSRAPEKRVRLLTYVLGFALITSYLFTCPITVLSSEFKIYDLGNAHYFLGVEVTPTSMGLMLSQLVCF